MALVSAVVQDQSLTQELPHAGGMATKKKKKFTFQLEGDGCGALFRKIELLAYPFSVFHVLQILL